MRDVRSTQARDSESSRRNMLRAKLQGCLSRRTFMVGCGENLRRLGSFDGRCRSITRFRTWARKSMPRTCRITKSPGLQIHSGSHLAAEAVSCGNTCFCQRWKRRQQASGTLPTLGEDACARLHRAKWRSAIKVLCCIAVAREQ